MDCMKKTPTAKSLAQRIAALFFNADGSEMRGEDNSPASLIWVRVDEIARCENVSLAQAVEVLAERSGDYGDGAMGGLNVYCDEDGTERPDWTTDDNSTWMSLESLVLEAECGDEGVPRWFDDEWKLVSNHEGGWISKMELEYL
jgi:hypothetical protein